MNETKMTPEELIALLKEAHARILEIGYFDRTWLQDLPNRLEAAIAELEDAPRGKPRFIGWARTSEMLAGWRRPSNDWIEPTKLLSGDRFVPVYEMEDPNEADR